MKLDNMKRIAAARTKGEWRLEWALDDKLICSKLLNEQGIPTALEFRTGSVRDAQFIAMASNQFDKLMAVVEAARVFDLQPRPPHCCVANCPPCTLRKALKALESE